MCLSEMASCALSARNGSSDACDRPRILLEYISQPEDQPSKGLFPAQTTESVLLPEESQSQLWFSTSGFMCLSKEPGIHLFRTS